MSEKRKISIRKIIQTLVTLVLVLACVVALSSASRNQEKKRISGVNIFINNSSKYRFVDEKQIKEVLFINKHIEPTHLFSHKVDLKKMENILKSNPWIANAEVFIDNKKKINILVTQRQSRLRIFDRLGASYYLDEDLKLLPPSDEYTPYEMIFVNVPVIKEDSMGEDLKKKMLFIAGTIKNDTFWQAQTASINVNSANDFEINPVMGKHKILLGDTSGLQMKLENIFAFYQSILNQIGWEKYQIIDARYKNQIIGSPALPWKAPVDRALTNMNWVKSIVGEANKETKTH